MTDKKMKANAGPLPGDHPTDRFIASLPLPVYPTTQPREQAANPIMEIQRLVAANDELRAINERLRAEAFDRQAAPEAPTLCQVAHLRSLLADAWSYVKDGGGDTEAIDKALASTGAAPEAPASEQQAVRAGTFAHLERLSQATTRPYEPVYQVWQIGVGGWRDTTKAHYDITPENARRIINTPAATTASQSDADKLLAMRAEYDRKEGAARITLTGGATTASASGRDLYEESCVSRPDVEHPVWGDLSDTGRSYWDEKAATTATTASASFQKFDTTDYSKPVIYSNSADRATAPSRDASENFADWLKREMPAGTVISDPAWWAPRILRAAMSAATKQGEKP